MLYLQAIAQNNPTGYFCRYKESENNQPDSCFRYGLMSYQWLCSMQQKEQNFIQSRFNIGERYVSKYGFKVDNFCKERNTIYKFEGWLWHGCDVCNANYNADGSLRKMDPIKTISLSEIRKTTQKKNKPLPQKDFEWCPSENVSGENKKQQEIAFFSKTLKCVQPKRQVGFEKILEGVKSKELYGFLIVDIHTPNDL